MKKRFVALSLTMFLILSMIPAVMASNTAIFEDSNGIIYHLSASKEFAIVIDAKSSAGSITIANNVTIDGTAYPVYEISDNAFYGSSVTSVTLPSSITYIGDQAFAFCPVLTSVNFNNATAALGNKIFSGSAHLDTITNYGNIYKVGYSAFDFTTWFETKKSETQDSAIYLGKVLLAFCGDASSFGLYSDVVSIAPNAFKDNKTLSTINLPGVKYVGISAFEGCTSLSNVNFDETIEEIGANAFDGCTALSFDLTLPQSMKKIGSNAFASTALSSVVLSGSSVESIGNGAFRNCHSLKKAILSDATVSIGNYAFENSEKLSEIYAANVTSVGYDAFRGCTSLSDKEAFKNLENAKTGAFDGTDFYDSADANGCTVGKVFYKTDETEILLAVSDGVVSIAPFAFYNAENAALLALPYTLEAIGENAFMSLSEGTIFVFSHDDSIYKEVSNVIASTIYIPKNKTLNNNNASVGYINGIVIDKLPNKTNYNTSESLDTSGIVILLETELDGVTEYHNINEIGYTPTFEYDFTKSNVVTVNYCSITATFEVNLDDTSVKKGDANNDGTVNSDDIIIFRKYIAGLVGTDSINFAACELDGIDGVNSDDLIVLRKVIAGLVSLD